MDHAHKNTHARTYRGKASVNDVNMGEYSNLQEIGITFAIYAQRNAHTNSEDVAHRMWHPPIYCEIWM